MTMTETELRQSLQILKMKQVEMAEALGVRPETVNRWIRGKSNIPGPAARAIRGMVQLRLSPPKVVPDKQEEQHAG